MKKVTLTYKSSMYDSDCLTITFELPNEAILENISGMPIPETIINKTLLSSANAMIAIKALVAENKLITAIKLYRNTFNVSLIEAKEEVYRIKGVI